MSKPDQGDGGAHLAVFNLSAQASKRSDLMQPLQARNVVMLPHREAVKSALIRDPDLFDKGRHQRFRGLGQRHLRIKLNADFHADLDVAMRGEYTQPEI